MKYVTFSPEGPVVEIWFVTSEATPLAKTGGLADVCGALPRKLADHGHDVRIVMPWYGWIDGEPSQQFYVQVGEYRTQATLGSTTLADEVPVDLIGSRYYFDRQHPYGDDGPFPDNDQRFCFFSRAVLKHLNRTNTPPDVIHCHDWFTGLVPYHLSEIQENPPATVLTIHNLRHQGVFPGESMRFTGLGPDHFRMERLEFHGQINLLKAGILGADRLTTVSPTYANEIQTEAHGEGLHGVLQNRADDLQGIVNGIDPETWHPARDEHLQPEERYESSDRTGKDRARNNLLTELELTKTDRPLVGFVGRLVDQKGIRLLLNAWKEDNTLPGTWLFLGTGDAELEQQLRELEQRHPDRVRALIEFNETTAHRIEAASDIFVMPSKFEPCGLNQMYSMQYGTVPVVHDTGGLRDTVHDPRRDKAKSATGFRFQQFSTQAFQETFRHAVDVFHNHPDQWKNLATNGMESDWTWSRSAHRYEELYKSLVKEVGT